MSRSRRPLANQIPGWATEKQLAAKVPALTLKIQPLVAKTVTWPGSDEMLHLTPDAHYSGL